MYKPYRKIKKKRKRNKEKEGILINFTNNKNKAFWNANYNKYGF